MVGNIYNISGFDMDAFRWIYKRLLSFRMMANKYTILIRGENIIIAIDGEMCKVGFFTTRYIKANSEAEAKKFAIKLITEEIEPSIKNDIHDPPTYIFENIIVSKSFGGHIVPGSGFTFFKEDSDE